MNKMSKYYQSVMNKPSTIIRLTDSSEELTMYTSEEDTMSSLFELEAMYPEVEELSCEDGVLVVRMPKDWLVIGPEEEDD